MGSELMNAADIIIQPGWTAFLVASHLALGTALGVLYFQTMWRGVRLLAGRRPLKAVIVAMLARFAILGGILALTALEGATPLLATALGIMAGRFLVMRRVRGASG
jgi:hypothetical protein